MTVAELIARLRELPPDAIVMVRDSDGDMSRVDDADLMEMRFKDWAGVKQTVYITGNF